MSQAVFGHVILCLGWCCCSVVMLDTESFVLDADVS